MRRIKKQSLAQRVDELKKFLFSRLTKSVSEERKEDMLSFAPSQDYLEPSTEQTRLTEEYLTWMETREQK